MLKLKLEKVVKLLTQLTFLYVMASWTSMFRLCGSELQAWTRKDGWSWSSCGFVLGRWWEFSPDDNDWLDDNGVPLFLEEEDYLILSSSSSLNNI